MSVDIKQTTQYWIEQLVIEALLEGVDLTDNIQHFHTDVENEAWPLVFVKASLAHTDESEIVVNGKQAEVYDVLIGVEWALEDDSAINVDTLAQQCRVAVDDANPSDLRATEQFFYFRPERRGKGDQSIEKDIPEHPTRRVVLDTFEVTVIRSS